MNNISSYPTVAVKKKRLIAIIIIFLLTSLVYLNSLNNTFHFDDRHSIVENFNIRDIGNVPKYFTRPEMFSGTGTKMYRPVLLITYAINYRLGGYNVFGYHVVNILLHAVNSVMVFLIAFLILNSPSLLTSVGTVPILRIPSPPYRKWGQSLNDSLFTIHYSPAFLAALLFGVHTINTQTVNYISSRSVLLVSLFYLGAFYFYIKSGVNGMGTVPILRLRFATSVNRDSPHVGKGQKLEEETSDSRFTIHDSPVIIHYLLSLLFYSCALLSKEIAITLPLGLLLYDFTIGNRSETNTIHDSRFTIHRLIRHLPFWIISGGYLLIRKSLFNVAIVGVSRKFLIGTSNVGSGGTQRSVYINLLTQSKAIIFYIKSLFLPTGLSVVHDTTKVSGSWDYLLLASFGIIVLLLMVAAVMYRKYRIVTFSILWFFVVLLPETILPLRLIINEHRIYLPGVGYAFIVGFLFQGLRSKVKDKSSKVVLIGVMLLVISLNAYGTIRRNEVWRDDYTLWKDAVKKYPGNVFSRNNLGYTYRRLGLLDKAMEQYVAAKKINPADPVVHNNLAATYLEKGFVDKAIEEFEAALELKADYSEAHNGLGAVFYKKGLLDEAEREYRMAIKFGPNYPKAHFNLGLVYKELGKISKAEGEFKQALILYPGYYKARRELGDIYLMQEKYDLAIEEYRQILASDPSNMEVRRSLRRILREMEKIQKN